MIVHVDESPVGTGKTERAIEKVVGVPARWLLAVEKIDAITELADRIRARARGSIVPHEIASTGARRGNSVRQEVEALPSRYQSGHVVAICTHAALMMSDLRAFEGWHLIVDEVPNVLLMSEVQSKLDVTFFEAHYALTHVRGLWWQVTLTEAGRRIDGSDLQQDDSHRHLRMFHQRVADSERDERAVVCNLQRWSDMRQPDLQWTWWSLFSVRQLAAFETIRFLGNGFMDSVSAKMMQRWARCSVDHSVNSRGPTSGKTIRSGPLFLTTPSRLQKPVREPEGPHGTGRDRRFHRRRCAARQVDLVVE